MGIKENDKFEVICNGYTYLKQYGGTLYDTAIFAVQHACEKWVAAL